MSMERRLNKIEEKLLPKEPVVFRVVYGREDEPGYEVKEIQTNILWRPK